MIKRLLFVALCVCVPAVALAQPASPLPPTPPPVTSADREGVYMQANLGGFFAVGADVETGGSRISNLEPVAGIELGYDLSPSFALQFMANLGSVYRAPIDLREGTTESYSLLLLDLMVMYRARLSERLAFFARVGGGGAIASPSVIGTNAVSMLGNVTGGLGLNLFTYLEGITVSLEADYSLVVPAMAHAIAIFPSVRYTF
jgi:hypothetical protein